MEENSTYYVDLIIRYLSGEATPEEVATLSSWLKSSTENQKQFNNLQKTWTAIDQNKVDSEIDIDEEWTRISAIIEPAANTEKETKIIQLDTNRRERPSLFQRFSRIAAVFILLAISASVVYFLMKKPGESKTISLLAKTESVEKKLPDGSSITLNSGSISYPENLSGKSRTIKLQGEAYFNVVHDSTRPFIIEAGNLRIEDIGTSFYVNTNDADGNILVVLTSGSVAVYDKDKPKDRTILVPGEKAVFSKAKNTISKSQNEDVNYMAFKTKMMVFCDTPMSEIVETLNRVYHSDIRIMDSKVGGCRITSTFNDKSLDAVLNVLKATIDVNIVKSGSSIQISANAGK